MDTVLGFKEGKSIARFAKECALIASMQHAMANFVRDKAQGVSITSGQIKNSKYWTSAAKNATLTASKYLRGAGTIGIAAGTLVSGYEL